MTGVNKLKKNKVEWMTEVNELKKQNRIEYNIIHDWIKRIEKTKMDYKR